MGARGLTRGEVEGGGEVKGAWGKGAALAALSAIAGWCVARRMAGSRLLELMTAGHQVWDASKFRPMQWSDVAILLRSPSGKAESYAKEFSRLKIPLEVARGGFYESQEISDLLSLLKVLDNPLQDIPALAVLHSPLVGLTLDGIDRAMRALTR